MGGWLSNVGLEAVVPKFAGRIRYILLVGQKQVDKFIGKLHTPVIFA
jgi:hypothetical protein